MRALPTGDDAFVRIKFAERSSSFGFRCQPDGLMKLTFVETPWFTKRPKSRMDDEFFRAIQNQLAGNPTRGTVMPGCGGLKKLRFADPSRGKGTRGGIRLIYLHIPEAFRIDFFDVRQR